MNASFLVPGIAFLALALVSFDGGDALWSVWFAVGVSLLVLGVALDRDADGPPGAEEISAGDVDETPSGSPEETPGGDSGETRRGGPEETPGGDSGEKAESDSEETGS